MNGPRFTLRVLPHFRDEVLLSSKLGVPLVSVLLLLLASHRKFISKYELSRAISRQVC